jgi:hypothetical protein
MALSLTCDCGARFDVDESLAGQSVTCPECQAAVKAPAAHRPVVRTSGFALASFLLAIVGAFTVVGTAAAVVLGLLAVLFILRDRERQAGLGFAVCGIVLGVVFTGLTLWSLSTGELFGLGSTLRRNQMADQLDPIDPKAPLVIAENGFSITRPSIKWQRAKKDFQYLMVQPLLRTEAVLLLVQPDLYAFIDVQVEADGRTGESMDDYILNRMKPIPTHSNGGGKDKAKDKGKPAQKDDEDHEEPSRLGEPLRVASRELPADGPVQQAHETTVEQTVDGKTWTLLIRTYRTVGGRLFIVRGFAEKARFSRVKDELEKALDSFQVVKGS